MATNPPGPRALPFVLALIGAVTLVIALIHTPIGEWGTGAYLFAVILAVISVMWLIVGFRKSYSLMGKMSPRSGVIVSGIGVIAAGVVAGTTIFADNWDVENILTTGLWLSLGLMFIVGFSASYKAMKAS
jgi:hypothetical protein